jgi:hypothetical protein
MKNLKKKWLGEKKRKIGIYFKKSKQIKKWLKIQFNINFNKL